MATTDDARWLRICGILFCLLAVSNCTKFIEASPHQGFMLFGMSDHGALLRLAGQKRKAIQYVVGNPVFALQMTRHDIRASLYAPLRVLIYENEDGKTCIEYDKPSSLFGQFGNAEIDAIAAMLDRKLETLVSAVAR